MTTMVGTQKNLVEALDALLELDYDAIEAYKAAIDRLDDSNDKAQLRSFLADHQRHVSELRPLITRLGGSPSEGPDLKQWLTKGKVVIMGLAGNRAVLLAMKTNEDDTNTAYERVVKRDDLEPAVREILEKNLSDERRHREWIEGRLATGQHAHAR
jgi:uncharacterized protein (TIGR02284 family)